jgi:hypothetical protein
MLGYRPPFPGTCSHGFYPPFIALQSILANAPWAGLQSVNLHRPYTTGKWFLVTLIMMSIQTYHSRYLLRLVLQTRWRLTIILGRVQVYLHKVMCGWKNFPQTCLQRRGPNVDRHIVGGPTTPAPIRGCYGEGGDRRVREEGFRADVVGVVVRVDAVEVDWFVTVEAGVLLLDSIPLTLEGPFPREGAGLDFLDPDGVLPKRPLFEVEVEEPLTLRLATCKLLPPSPFSPLTLGSMELGRGGDQGPRGFQGKAARNFPM